MFFMLDELESDLSELRMHVASTWAVDFLTVLTVQLMRGQSLPQG